MTRSYTSSQIADGLLAGEFTRGNAFVPLAEVERLRASNERLYRALFRIAGKAPFADDPWTIAMEAMKREAKP